MDMKKHSGYSDYHSMLPPERFKELICFILVHHYYFGYSLWVNICITRWYKHSVWSVTHLNNLHHYSSGHYCYSLTYRLDKRPLPQSWSAENHNVRKKFPDYLIKLWPISSIELFFFLNRIWQKTGYHNNCKQGNQISILHHYSQIRFRTLGPCTSKKRMAIHELATMGQFTGFLKGTSVFLGNP